MTVLVAATATVIFLGSNAYIVYRMFQCLRTFLPNVALIGCGIAYLLTLACGIACVLKSSLPVGAVGKRAVSVIGGYWMGLFVYLFLLFIVSDVILLLLRLTGILAFPFGGAVRRWVGLAVMTLSVAVVALGAIHANRFAHRSYDVETDKDLSGRQWKIVLVSDIHLGAVGSERRLKKMAEEINGESPDIVCIAGDIFDNDFTAVCNAEGCAEALKSIKATYGVYACLGNHDAGSTVEDMIAFLRRCDITLLNEKSATVDGALVLAGRLDASPIGGYGNLRRGDFEDVARDANTALPVVVLDHTPSHIEEYPNWVDLILCGHTHRGQIFPGSLITNKLFTVDFGKYKKEAASPTVIVTSGAGIWGPPMRTGSDCEIVTIRLFETP